MNLYTLIIDFDGGTYITQGEATNPSEAPKNCIINWDISDIPDILTEQDKSIILANIMETDFVPLRGMKNIWSSSIELHQHFLILNLVKTEGDS